MASPARVGRVKGRHSLSGASWQAYHAACKYVICVPHCRGLTQDAEQQLAEQCACQSGALEPQVRRAAVGAGGRRWWWVRRAGSGRGRLACCSIVSASGLDVAGKLRACQSGRAEQQARRPTRQDHMGPLPGQFAIVLRIINHSEHWSDQRNNEEVVCVSIEPRAWL